MPKRKEKRPRGRPRKDGLPAGTVGAPDWHKQQAAEGVTSTSFLLARDVRAAIKAACKRHRLSQSAYISRLVRQDDVVI